METIVVWLVKLAPQKAREEGEETARTLPRVFSPKLSRNVEIEGSSTLPPPNQEAESWLI